MDFIVGLPRTSRGYNMIWVIVVCLTKSAHYKASSNLLLKLLEAYIDI
jgi:hypothetical protein